MKCCHNLKTLINKSKCLELNIYIYIYCKILVHDMKYSTNSEPYNLWSAFSPIKKINYTNTKVYKLIKIDYTNQNRQFSRRMSFHCHAEKLQGCMIEAEGQSCHPHLVQQLIVRTYLQFEMPTLFSNLKYGWRNTQKRYRKCGL